MSYLDRLKAEFSEKRSDDQVTKVTKAPSVTSVTGPSRHIPKSDPGETSGHWLISLPPERQERWFSPPASRAELENRFPGAVLIALPDAPEPARQANAEEAAELTRLVAAAGAQEGFTPEEQAEALANALRDAANALRCFRALLNEDGT